MWLCGNPSQEVSQAQGFRVDLLNLSLWPWYIKKIICRMFQNLCLLQAHMLDQSLGPEATLT